MTHARFFTYHLPLTDCQLILQLITFSKHATQMIVLIDNYDSFTYNLYHYIRNTGEDVDVVRNDVCTISELKNMNPEKLVLSPGPGTPDDAGICMDVIREMGENTPILGICLGHQSMGQVFGADIVRGKKPMHAVISDIHIKNKYDVFKDVPDVIKATRYHSLIIRKDTLPECLEITAESSDGVIQGIRHTEQPLYGLQFHPESIASEFGHKIIENFVRL